MSNSKRFELGNLSNAKSSNSNGSSVSSMISSSNGGGESQMICPFSGICILRPLVSADELRERMQNRQFIRPCQIRGRINKATGDIEGDWVTIAVVTNKLPFRKTKTGNDFSIWRLNDLRTLDQTLVLMMFGKAHQEHCKMYPGQVIGLLNPKILPNNTSGSSKSTKDNKSDITISVDNGNRILYVGNSKDFGLCKGQKKNGDICNAVINMSEGKHCLYHIRLDYQRVQSMRPELQSTLAGVQPKNSPMEMLLHQEEYAVKKSTDSRNKVLTEFEKEKKAELLQKYHERKETEANALSKQISNQNAHSLAAQNLLQTRKQALSDCSSPSIQSQQMAKTLLAKMAASEKLPQLGKGITSDGIIDFSESKKPKLTGPALAKQRAIAMVKERARERQQQETAARAGGADQSRRRVNSSLDRILARVEANLQKPEELLNLCKSGSLNTEVSEQARQEAIKLKRKRMQEEEEAKRRKQDAIDAIMSRKSAHESEVKKVESEAMDKYFNLMEQKEKLDERLTEKMEMRCDVIQCKMCQYTASSQSDYCKSQRHTVQRRNMLKRFFRCKHCRARTCTYDQLVPTRRCNCGSDQFERTAMQDERKLPQSDKDKLLIRGEEIKFLNSL